MTEHIYLSKAVVGEIEEQYVLEALRSGWIAPLGPSVDAFETEVAERCGVGHALALSSGTAALQLALLHLGAAPGSVVLCPSMTFAATANAITYTGAEPVFVDSLVADANVDAELMLAAADQLLEEGRTVVAATPVDLYGRCADYDTLVPGLAERGIALLEDAAEALGASLGGRAAGSFGQAAALSFNGNKIMTTSGGGMLLTDDADLVTHARKLSTQAREPVPWYEHTEIGYNFRLSNLLAALGRAQLTRLDDMIARRRAIRAHYRSELAGLPVRFLPDGADGPDDRGDNCWLTTIEIDHPGVDVDRLTEDMLGQGIEVRHLWKPMHLQPVFSNARSFLTGGSEQLFDRAVNIPSGAGLTDDDVTRVATALRRHIEAL